jgi:hypothetical protein
MDHEGHEEGEGTPKAIPNGLLFFVFFVPFVVQSLG